MSVSSDLLPRELADKLAHALHALPGIAALHPGQFGEVALLYPHHRVRGLSMSGGRLGVHIVVDLSVLRPFAELAEAVRATASNFNPDVPIDVYFADAEVSA